MDPKSTESDFMKMIFGIGDTGQNIQIMNLLGSSMKFDLDIKFLKNIHYFQLIITMSDHMSVKSNPEELKYYKKIIIKKGNMMQMSLGEVLIIIKVPLIH